MKKILKIVLAVVMVLSTIFCVSSVSATTVKEKTNKGTVQITKSTKRIPLKRPKISKITVGKYDVGDTIYRKPKITFNKIPNAIRYRVAYKCPNKPNKWKYFTTKENKVLVGKGYMSGSGKYYVKVRAEAPKTKYKAGKWSKVKTITINKYETHKKNCYKCGHRIGRGNGKCSTFTSDGFCFYCGEPVKGHECHVCINATPMAKNRVCYEFETGELVLPAEELKKMGILVKGMKGYK